MCTSGSFKRVNTCSHACNESAFCMTMYVKGMRILQSSLNKIDFICIFVFLKKGKRNKNSWMSINVKCIQNMYNEINLRQSTCRLLLKQKEKKLKVDVNILVWISQSRKSHDNTSIPCFGDFRVFGSLFVPKVQTPALTGNKLLHLYPVGYLYVREADTGGVKGHRVFLLSRHYVLIQHWGVKRTT